MQYLFILQDYEVGLPESGMNETLHWSRVICIALTHQRAIGFGFILLTLRS